MPKQVLPRIAEVRVETAPYTLRIRWRDGADSVIDVQRPVSEFRLYAQLHGDPELFRTARVGEHGTDVIWTDDIDMSAELLHRLAREQSGATMSSQAFRRWRERKAYTLEGAARALGLSRRTIAYYEEGSKPIPRVVALATRGLDAPAPGSQDS